MIRRLSQGAIREAETHHVVTGGSAPDSDAMETVVSTERIESEAYRKGYAEGFEAGESDGLRDINQRMHELQETARERLLELTDERDRLSALTAGLAKALHDHAEAVESLAVEVALASLARAFGHMHEDGQLLQRLCTRMVEEFRVKAVRVAVSTQDRPLLPQQIDGLEVVVEAGLVQGDCRVVTARGQMESSIGLRLRSIYEVMIESLEIDSA